ncbi:MAG: multicopper oxidase domain-containing protein [Longimicrobiales bacterium]|nr:multicopper oxidase domain-containing protein [Longimicrobiales bacterium]
MHRLVHRVRPALAAALAAALLPGAGAAQDAPGDVPQDAPRDVRQDASALLLPAGVPSGLPLVQPNRNIRPAGVVRDGVREIALEVMRSDWRVETPAGPGLKVAAVAEEGALPSIPAPLIRVSEGTRVRVRIHNRLPAPVTVFGLYDRSRSYGSAEADAAVEVAPGGRAVVEFTAGAAGTFLYRLREGPAPDPETLDAGVERDQLAGALVVDPADGAPADRIMVVNIFSEPMDRSDPDGEWFEALTINGRSWPYTEPIGLEVGERVRWRLVNASQRDHPMHLHGFYYEVHARGDAAADTLYDARDRRLVVTETMLAGTTMLMEWAPTRPGRWIFHCHLSFHVAPHLRLPGAAEADPAHAHSHMAGLVMGIDVAPGPTDLVATETVRLDLFANEYGAEQGYRYGFARTSDSTPDSFTEAPGPLLVFNRHQAAEVTVHNTMSVPTGVHWHGLELDAWADGVPDWSASDGRVSPVIHPGERFTYRLSFLRPGTFIYHSHLDDIPQLTGGLYGPLLVLPEGERFDARTDHPLVWGWNTPTPQSLGDVELNGRQEQPEGRALVGETHRFRLINIAPAGRVSAWIRRDRDGEPVPYTLLAKDGADLPAHQRVPVEHLQRIGVGETADFTWTPAEPGVYHLLVGPDPEQAALVQRWVVEARPAR